MAVVSSFSSNVHHIGAFTDLMTASEPVPSASAIVEQLQVAHRMPHYAGSSRERASSVDSEEASREESSYDAKGEMVADRVQVVVDKMDPWNLSKLRKWNNPLEIPLSQDLVALKKSKALRPNLTLCVVGTFIGRVANNILDAYGESLFEPLAKIWNQ